MLRAAFAALALTLLTGAAALAQQDGYRVIEAADPPRGLRFSTTRARSTMGKPSALVNSRQPSGIVLRDKGEIARPVRAATRRLAEVSHSNAARHGMLC